MRPLAKYQAWYEDQHPRDAHGMWTTGMVGGGFAPAGDDDQPTPETPANPKEGHQDDAPWMGAMATASMAQGDLALDSATGAPNSGWLPSAHAFTTPTNPEVAAQGAAQLSALINSGDLQAAKKLVNANPEILHPFRKQHHGSVANAKKAAAFLNATTDATWVQHGVFVNKPKVQPPKEALPAPAATAAPLPAVPAAPGSPKLIPFDAKKKLAAGTVGAAKAQADAEAIHAALSVGNVAQARKIAFANPEALTALYAMPHGSNLKAKSAAAFLHLMTGQTFAQHGTLVNQPKGAVPASSWAHPGFQGTGAPGYVPPAPGAPVAGTAADLTANTVTPPPVAPAGKAPIAVGDFLNGVDNEIAPHASEIAADIEMALHVGNEKLAANLLSGTPEAVHFMLKEGGSIDPDKTADFLTTHTDHNFSAVDGDLTAWPKQGAAPPPPPAAPAKPSLIPPPGIMPPPSKEQAAKIPPPADAPPKPFEPVEAKKLTGIPKTGGSNEGGFYELGDGTKGYAKFYSNPEMMQSEVFANSIYKALGIPAPDSKTVTIDGKKAVFSPLLENGKQVSSGATASSAATLAAHPQIKAGFFADALLANHDVFGQDHDNIMKTPDGQFIRIDNGGALKFRAQGGAKVGLKNDAIPEIDSLRNPQYGAGAVHQGISDEDAAKQVLAAGAQLSAQKVDELAKAAGFTGTQLNEYTGLINGRLHAAQAWAKQKLGAAGHPLAAAADQQIAAAQQPENAPAPVAPPPPVAGSIGEHINPLLSTQTAENATSKTALTPKDAALQLPVAKAIADQDTPSFVKAITMSPSHLAVAAQKKWQAPWPALQTAAVLEHLAGKHYTVKTDASGGYSVEPPDEPKVVVAPPPAPKVTLSQIAAANATLPPLSSITAWKHGDHTGTFTPGELGFLSSHTWASDTASAVAGIMEAHTGQKFQVAPNPDDDGNFYVENVPGAAASPTEGWPGQQSGFPDPSTYSVETSDEIPGMPVGSADQAQDGAETTSTLNAKIADAIADKKYEKAEWYKAWGKANDLLGDQHPEVPVPGGPDAQKAHQDASMATQMDYADHPLLPKDLASAGGVWSSAITSGGVDKLAATIKQMPTWMGATLLAAVTKEPFSSFEEASQIKDAINAGGLGVTASLNLVPDTAHDFKIKIDGVMPQHVDHLKSALGGALPGAGPKYASYADVPTTETDVNAAASAMYDATNQSMKGQATMASAVQTAFAPLLADPSKAGALAALGKKTIYNVDIANSVAQGLANSGLKTTVEPAEDGDGFHVVIGSMSPAHATGFAGTPNKPPATYDDVPFSAADLQAAAKLGKDAKLSGSYIKPLGSVINDPAKAGIIAAFAKMPLTDKYHAASMANGLKQNGVDAEVVEHGPGTWGLKIGAVSEAHKGAATGASPGAGSSPTPAAPAAPTGPLFSTLPAGVSKPNDAAMKAQVFGTAAKHGLGKLKYGGAGAVSQWSNSPAIMHHLATVPNTKKTMDRVAQMFNLYGSKYSAIVKKNYSLSGHFAYTLVFKAKTPEAAAAGGSTVIGYVPPKPTMPTYSSSFDAAAQAKDMPGGIMTSSTPLGLKLKNKAMLPKGIEPHDLVAPDHEDQKARVAALQAKGLGDSARFLEAHYAQQEAEPRHYKGDTQLFFPGNDKFYASPYLRPHEVMNQVLNGVGGKVLQLPNGVTPSMLDAKNPAERAQALDEISNSGSYAAQPHQWLSSYYKMRDEAASGSSPYVAQATDIPKQTAHPGFFAPHPFDINPPANAKPVAPEAAPPTPPKAPPNAPAVQQMLLSDFTEDKGKFKTGEDKSNSALAQHLKAWATAKDHAKLGAINWATFPSQYTAKAIADTLTKLGLPATSGPATNGNGYAATIAAYPAPPPPSQAATTSNAGKGGVAAEHGGNSVNVPGSSAGLGQMIANAHSLTTPRTDPIMGAKSGKPQDPTHLDLPAGKIGTSKIMALADKKASDVFPTLYAQHKAALLAHDADAEGDPFGDLPKDGANADSGDLIHELSQHGYRMSQELYKPMLETARAAMPAEGVLRPLRESGSISDISKGIFNAIVRETGIPSSAVAELQNDMQKWFGSAQKPQAYKIRTASNLLRGLAPDSNLHYGKTDPAEARAHANAIAKTISPDYMKVFLAHKAATQAAMERFADSDGDVAWIRGMDTDQASSMLGKAAGGSATAALAKGLEGQQWTSNDMTLTGGAPSHTYSGSGLVIHSVKQPEQFWHSFHYSPTHGTEGGNDYEGEKETFATSRAGKKYKLVSKVTGKGDFITTKAGNHNPWAHRIFASTIGGNDGKDIAARDTMWKLSDLAALAQSVPKTTMTKLPLPVPTNEDGWYRWTPPEFVPSQAHTDALLAAITDPHGVVTIAPGRDDGWREKHPDAHAKAIAGTLAPV